MLCGAAVCGAANVYAEEALIFEETFSNCKSTTIQGGYFAESLYFESAMMGDHDGWYTQNCYESERAIKFSAKTKHGKATSPELPIIGNSGDLKVCFRAQTWRGDELTVNVEVNGEVRTVDLAGTSQITDRSNACSEVTFTDVPAFEADILRYRQGGRHRCDALFPFGYPSIPGSARWHGSRRPERHSFVPSF